MRSTQDLISGMELPLSRTSLTGGGLIEFQHRWDSMSISSVSQESDRGFSEYSCTPVARVALQRAATRGLTSTTGFLFAHAISGSSRFRGLTCCLTESVCCTCDRYFTKSIHPEPLQLALLVYNHCLLPINFAFFVT